MTQQWPEQAQPGIGNPGTGHPEIVEPQYAQPQYAQPQYAQPQYAQPQYGQPQYPQAGGVPVAGEQPPPPPASRRRTWIIAAAAAGLLFVVAIVLLVVLIPRQSGPEAEYEAMAKTFHSKFTDLRKKLDSDIANAGERILDSTLYPAKDTAKALGELLKGHADGVRGLTTPEGARDEQDRLGRVLDAGRLIAVNAGAMFSKSQMKQLLGGVWAEFLKELPKAESAFVTALKE